MNAEHLLDAIGRIDEALIAEAEEKPARRKLPLWQVATAAAAAVVVCAGLYILPAMQPASTAAPESQRDVNEMSTVMDSALADGAFGYMTEGNESLRTEESKATAPKEDEDVAGGTQGVFEPVFRTEQGRYMLVGEAFPRKSKLPEDAQYLGELVKTNYDKPAYPSVGTEELVGRSVWQSADGDYLYIQDPAGGWLQATRAK